MGWGISPDATPKEKIKSEMSDFLQGLNSVGEISYKSYSEIFDTSMKLFDKMHDLANESKTVTVEDLETKMQGSIACIILVNHKNVAIVIDVKTRDPKCKPDVGYITEFDDWKPTKEEHMQDDDIWFDGKKAFPEPGIYFVDGVDTSCDTPDGLYESYEVLDIVKLSDLPYKM